MLEHIEQRNRDFMAECRRQQRKMLEEDGMISDRVVARRAMAASAPGYYVSYEYALRVVREYVKENPTLKEQSSSRSSRRRMVHEIAVKCRTLMESEPGMRLSKALTEVLVGERASSFFMTEAYALRLYYSLRRDIHRRGGRLRSRRLF